MLKQKNPGTPIFGLYGGPPTYQHQYLSALGPLLDDFWGYPLEKDPRWKWRNGDLMLSQWFTDHGSSLSWDSVFVAQWDTVVSAPVRKVLPPLVPGQMLLSGLRPVSEVQQWWQWVRWANRVEYESFLAHVGERYGAVPDPLCCQFIAMVLPREFLANYSVIDEPELGFLEYKVPIYAQAFGVDLVPDTCFHPWWPEEPRKGPPKRTACLMHAWRTPVKLPVMAYEAMRPGGRRVFHPYHGIYPHDLQSLRALLRRAPDVE